jgi:BirA family biotin operon repressor/biotin-[acetyl-CoA-carboxylase] ligase
MHRFVVRRHAVLTSTMDEARAQAHAGAPDGTVVVAELQTAGRGRRGRKWVSAEGNLLATILLRPRLPQSRLTELGFVVALALADAVDVVLAGGHARLKWPNDVLIDDAKVAGILIEIVDGGAALVGIGLNVAQSPADTPYPATCLRDAGASASCDEALTQLLTALDRRLAQWMTHGFAATRTAWLARGPAPGGLVRIRNGDRIDTGRFAGLDVDGALLLADAGAPRRIIAGDVVVAA